MRLILASASPRRAELMTAAGYTFTIHAVEIDERATDGEAPASYVERLAIEKSARAFQELGHPAETIVIGADTTVVVDDKILAKPLDDEDGARMLRLLSGRTHEVLTGVCVRSAESVCRGVESTSVFVRAITDEEVAWYVASGEGRDKAGGYAVQGLAARFIPRLDGSYSNVVGLPIATLDRLLKRVR